MERRRWLPGSFWKSLAAVLLGNAVYYNVMPWLPPGARHQPFRIDLGLAVDAWFCLAAYGVVDLLVKLRKKCSG